MHLSSPWVRAREICHCLAETSTGAFCTQIPRECTSSEHWLQSCVSPHFFQSCVTFFTVARSGTEQAPWHDSIRVLHGTVVTAQAINSYKNLFIWRIRLGYWERHQLSEILQGSWIPQLGPTLLSALSPTPSQPLGNGCGRAEIWASSENRVPQGESTREKRQAEIIASFSGYLYKFLQ